MEDITPTITTLHNLLDYEARKFGSGEFMLKNALSRWIEKCDSLKLRDVINRYHDLVGQHAEKIEGFIESEKILSLSSGNRVMKAFIDETEERITRCGDPEVRDACLLASIQEINHFKISSYGTAAAFSKALGMDQPAAIFFEAEINEKKIDDRLTQLAEFEINNRARAPITLPG